MTPSNPLCNAEISAGSLMLAESRKIARLLLGDPTDAEWRKALVEDNVLQKKAPSTAIRQARLIRNRMGHLDKPALELIASREPEVATQLLMLASIRHSRLLKDFMADVLLTHVRQLEMELSVRDWDAFLIECEFRDPSVKAWTTSTRDKLLQVILRVLAEAKYLASTRSMKIQRVQLHPDVRHYLEQRNEKGMIDLMELKQ